MTPETAAAIYDHLLPGWREAPRNGQNRRVSAPYREDEHPSLDVHEQKLTWFDRGIGEGGGAVDLARRVLGEEGARSLLREFDADPPAAGSAPQPSEPEPKPLPEVQVFGPPTSAQISSLKRSRRLRDGDTLERIGAKLARCWGDEWLGFPALVDGGWKLWALDCHGVPRLGDQGKLIRKNVGPVSFLVSPALRDRNGADTPRVFDVEGESDFLAAIEAGIPYVVAPTGGAGSLAAHKRHRDSLLDLKPTEVVVVRDLDQRGRDGAEKAVEWWTEQGVPARNVELPECLGEGGDLRDYLNGRPARDGKPAVEPLGGAADLDALADAAELPRYCAARQATAQAATSPILTAEEHEDPSEDQAPEHLTDVGNARRLVRQYGEDLHFVHAWGKWLVWDGQRWVVDPGADLMRRAKAVARSLYEEAAQAPDADTRKALAGHARRSESEPRLKATVSLAASEPEIPILPEELDQDPWALNVLNGTLDLRTGKLREHDRDDWNTKLAPVVYDSASTAPLWKAHLEKVLPDADLRAFLQRAVGYSLSGLTTEQILFIIWGGGANGKSVTVETLLGLLGDYACKTPSETLLARREGSIPNDVARLQGARFVSSVEMEEGRRLAESRIKELTGGDTVTARFMRAEFFEFRPVCKLWMATNHKPLVRGTDLAIWRRLRLVPFTVTIPEKERDHHLLEKLRGELPGILAWAIRGCLEWQRDGLCAPEAVLLATKAYREEEDLLGEFFRERCVRGIGHWVLSGALYQAYGAWCEQNREKPISQKALGAKLGERGYESDRKGHGGKRVWWGIGLRDDGDG